MVGNPGCKDSTVKQEILLRVMTLDFIGDLAVWTKLDTFSILKLYMPWFTFAGLRDYRCYRFPNVFRL